MVITDKQAAGVAIATGLAALLLYSIDRQVSLPQFKDARAKAANLMHWGEGIMRPNGGNGPADVLEKQVLVYLQTPNGQMQYRCEPGPEQLGTPNLGAAEILQYNIELMQAGGIVTKGKEGFHGPIPAHRVWEVFDLAANSSNKHPEAGWAYISILDAQRYANQLRDQGADYNDFGFLNRQPILR